jgi:predicted ATPase
VKFTEYFKAMRDRPDRADIKIEWIERTIQNPIKKQVQADGRIRFWKKIEENEGRYLRVILLEDEETIHNAFFDRNFKEDEQ